MIKETMANLASNLYGEMRDLTPKLSSLALKPSECDSKLGAVTNAYIRSVNTVNGDVENKFGNDVSVELAEYLHKDHMLGIFEKANEHAADIMTCGRSEGYVKAMADYSPNVYDSLALMNTEPQKMDFFGSLMTAATDKSMHYISNLYNSVAEKIGAPIYEVKNQILHKAAETSSSTGGDESQYALAVGILGTIALSALVGRKLNKFNLNR